MLPTTIQPIENGNLDLYIANRIPGIMETIETTKIAVIAGIAILIILGLIILWNQRKIKKMLRDLKNQNPSSGNDENKTFL